MGNLNGRGSTQRAFKSSIGRVKEHLCSFLCWTYARAFGGVCDGETAISCCPDSV